MTVSTRSLFEIESLAGRPSIVPLVLARLPLGAELASIRSYVPWPKLADHVKWKF